MTSGSGRGLRRSGACARRVGEDGECGQKDASHAKPFVPEAVEC
jgi:hypothetical protein